MPLAAFPNYPILLFPGDMPRAPEPALERTDMESGPPKQAPKVSRVMTRVPVRYRLLTKADYLAFIAWHRDTIKQGSDWFTWIDPLTAAARTARIVGGKIEANATRKDLERWNLSFELEFWG